jgi:hypothetical protein
MKRSTPLCHSDESMTAASEMIGARLRAGIGAAAGGSVRTCEKLSPFSSFRHLAIEDKAVARGAVATPPKVSSQELPAMVQDLASRLSARRGKGRSSPPPIGSRARRRHFDALSLAVAARYAVAEDRITLRVVSSAAVMAAVPLGLSASHSVENSDPRRSDRRGSAAFWEGRGTLPKAFQPSRAFRSTMGAALWSGSASFCWSPGQSQSWG